MKIVYVNDALAIWGGLERVLVEKVNELAERYDYEMYLLTINQGNHPIPYPLHPKVVYRDLGIQFHKQYQYHGFRRFIKRIELNHLFLRRLREQIDLISPNVIVCARSELSGTIAKAKGEIPFVFESHTSRHAQRFINADFYTVKKFDFYNRSVKFADSVVALTNGDADDWREINPNVCVIPNIVHLYNGSRYCDSSSKSVMFVGRFSTQKDISSLLQIWQIVHLRYPDWALHIYAGFGEEQDELLPKIEQMKVNIFLHEPTPEIFERYLENSVLLLTSRFEPFGLVLPEAMSCGLPVIAFDCPYGPADIITDGKDGFLVKNRDINEFAEKVCLLIENPKLRKLMGQAGIESSKRYDTSLIMPNWKNLFEQLTTK